MSSSFVIFCVQICLIQYAVSQTINANGPTTMNNGLQNAPNTGLQYGPNTNIQYAPNAAQQFGPSSAPLQGQAQISPAMNGAGVGTIRPNQPVGPYNQIRPNGQGLAGMPNQAFANAGRQRQIFNGASKANQIYNGAGTSTGYGGSGNGEVTVNGELPVSGMTSVMGHVPLTGKVAFNGNVPCGGVVTISGSCASCGLNANSYGQNMATYGNKPIRY